MSSTSIIVSEQQDRFLPVCIASAGCVLGYILAPMTAPGLVPAAALALAVWLSANSRQLPVLVPSSLLLMLGLAGAYLLINSSWSLAPSSAYASVALYFALVVICFLTIDALYASSLKVLRVVALGICIGVACGAMFLLFEVLSNQAVHRLLMSQVPMLRTNAREAQLEGGWVTFLPQYMLNRSATAVSLCLWPTLLMIGQIEAERWKKVLLYAGIAGGILAIMGSDHETSKLACLGGALTYIVFLLSPVSARRLTIAGWIVATLLVVPLCSLAYSQQLYRAWWLPDMASHRIVIWGYTTEQLAHAPVFGAGIATPRVLNERTRNTSEFAPGTEYKRSTRSHSHNIYLQIWFETGAVGAGMLLVLGLLVLGSLQAAADRAQPYLYAAFVTSALVGASSFSLWAPWFMASFALAVILAGVGAALTRQATDRRSHIPSA
jgi:O-antigen ligase